MYDNFYIFAVRSKSKRMKNNNVNIILLKNYMGGGK